MSIANDNSSGNKGNNGPFQIGMLRDKSCVGHEVLVLDDTVSQLDFPVGSTYALISVEAKTGNGVRYWSDSSGPSSTEGHFFEDGGVFDITGLLNLRRFKVIGVSAATLMVSYFK